MITIYVTALSMQDIWRDYFGPQAKPRVPPLGEIPYALAEINLVITKSEAC